MSLKNASQLVSEHLLGACGEETRAEMIADVSSALVDTIFERLLDQGIRFEDQNVYREIESLVAHAMIIQAEHEIGWFNEVVKVAA